MALTLHLLRHAKSSWADPGQSDHDRPLNSRGRKAATAMGEFLAREGPAPDRVLCSSAVRTQETLERVSAAFARSPAVAIEEGLYLASAGELHAFIRRQKARTACLLVIAHNPGIGDLALGLAGSGEEEPWHRMRQKYPTAALATLRFEIESWAEAAVSGGELVRFVVPRELV